MSIYKSITMWPFDYAISDLFDYIPETGLLMWKPRPSSMFKTVGYADHWNKQNAGREACAKIDKDGYKAITVLRKSLRAHRIVWMMHNGGECPEFIDHMNGNVQDNRIENLRPATKQQNGWNRGRNSNNTSGYKGVSFNKKLGKWKASIYFGGKVIHAGHYETAEEAHFAYCRKLKEISLEFFHP